MSEFVRTVWTKIKDGFEGPQRQTTSNAPVPPYATRTYTFNGDVIVEVDQQGSSTHEPPRLIRSHRPVFTVAVGVFDILMLITMYIVERRRVLSSDTYIKMGAKYAPCMRPLSSKADRLAYDSGYKTQCHAFLYPFQIYRFFMPMFLHGGVSHLLNNLVYQTLVGAILEKKYGTKIFAICYLLFGFSGNVMSVLSRPKSVSVGASGAVYGILFFAIIDNTLRIFTIKNTQDKVIQFLMMLLIIPYFIMSVFVDVDFNNRIDHAAHGGGALMGILLAIYLCEMPDFITSRVPNGGRRIQLIALIAIIGYFTISLLVFYLIKPLKIDK